MYAVSERRFWYTGSTEDLPPQIEQAIEEYVDQSYTKSLAVVPLRKPELAAAAAQPNVGGVESEQAHQGEIVGALIVEQIESEIPREILAPRLDMVYEHSTRAISNALEHHNLFLMPVWRAIGKSRVIVQGRNLPKTVIITLGVRGAFVSSEGIQELMPAFKTKAVDTTAAGDVFNGALAVGLAERLGLRAAVQFANAAAAISVTRLGAQPSAPKRKEITLQLQRFGRSR